MQVRGKWANLSPTVVKGLITKHFLLYVRSKEHFSNEDVGEAVGAAPVRPVSGQLSTHSASWSQSYLRRRSSVFPMEPSSTPKVRLK